MQRYKHGFTLIELLVVISIIGVLVAILLPALSKARVSAQSLTCQTSQRQSHVAMVQYTDANKDYLPIENGSWGKNTAAATTYTYKSDVYKYYIAYYGAGIGIEKEGLNKDIDFKGLFSCPTNTIANASDAIVSGKGNNRIDWNGRLGEHDGKRTVEGLVSRGLNPAQYTETTRRVSEMREMSKTVSMGDGLYYWLTIANTHYVVFRHGSTVGVPSPWVSSGTESSYNRYKALWDAKRLDGNANLAFMDGHVISLKWNDYIASTGTGKIVFDF